MIALTLIVVLALASGAYAMMGDPGATGGMMNNSFSMMNGPMMAATGSFGMMNGMAGMPVIGDDGTAYIMSFNPTAAPGTAPGSTSFASNIVAVSLSGQTSSVTLKGIVSRPVVSGSVMVATASLPDLTEFGMMANYSNNVPGGQSVVYLMPLPFSSSTVPQAVAMDGGFASVPVIASGHVYVVTSDFGSGMMTGNDTFSGMFGGYNFNGSGTAKSYLYVFNLDGTLFSKTTIQ